jgi:hypothetical protein
MRFDPTLLGQIYTIEKLMLVTQRFRAASKVLWIKKALDYFVSGQRKKQAGLFAIVLISMALFALVNTAVVYFFQSHDIPLLYFILFGCSEIVWVIYYFISIGLPFFSRSKYISSVTIIAKLVEYSLLATGFFYGLVDFVLLYFVCKIIALLVQIFGVSILMRPRKLNR